MLTAQVDQQLAQLYFKEAQTLCERDGGQLWGVSICGPIVIFDRQTQTIATSTPAPEGARPKPLGLVNAPLQWGGVTWGAYIWNDVASKFVDGPVLLFPGGNHSFDTRGAVVIQGIGTIYFGPFRAPGEWGRLEAEKGVLVSTDGSFRRVSAPVRLDETTYAGDGWTLKLAPGWVIREDRIEEATKW